MTPRQSALRRLSRKSPHLTLAAAAATAAVTAAVVAGASTAQSGQRTAPGRTSFAVTGTATHVGSHRSLAARGGDHVHPIGPASLVAFVAPGGAATAGASHPAVHAEIGSQRPASASPRPQAQRHPHAPVPCQVGPQLDRWICQTEQIMVAHGTPRSAFDAGAAVIVVTHESGGDPRASNGWDSNAAAGTPSEGIAQVIGPTFATYHLPGHDNIWNPVDNMVAAFRYAIARYGSMSSIPGVVAVRGGGSYVGY